MVFTINNTSHPALIECHGRLTTQSYYIPYQYQSLIGPEKLWNNPDVLEKLYLFVIDYWSATIWIALFYVAGIHLLQRVMASREAFELKWPLIIWNSAFALFSLAGTVRVSEEILHVTRNHPLIDSIIYSGDPFQPAAFWGFCFAVSKFFELGDTVFIVLRKKPLIFLHWYHHAVVLVLVWHGGKEMCAAGRWYGYINYVVHTLMYTYYALAAAGIRLPRSIAVTVTSLQTAQMFVGVAISFIAFYCKLQGHIVQQSYENLYFAFSIYVSFAVLFSKFFNKSYIEKRKKTKTQ